MPYPDGATTKNRKLRIFLCHASEDKNSALTLYDRLRNDQFEPWLDAKDLLPGQDWDAQIRKAVGLSDVVIVCLSHQSIGKTGYVQKEIVRALDTAQEKPEETIFIIPARLEECEVPSRLRNLHWVDLFSDDGYGRLVLALRARVQQLHFNRGAKKRVQGRPSGQDSSRRRGSGDRFRDREAKTKEIIGFAPAMVDVNIECQCSPNDYIATLNDFDARPGRWSTIDSMERLESLVMRISGRDLDSFMAAGRDTEVGSTIAGSLIAFNPQCTLKRSIHVAIGLDSSGNPNVYAKFVLDSLRERGLATIGVQWIGTTDICVSTHHKAVPDRTMIVYRGLLKPRQRLRLGTGPSHLFLVSAFEIARGFFDLDPALLIQTESALAIGLGDRQILDQKLSPQIKNLIREGVVAYLFGDISEYKQCFHGSKFASEVRDVLRTLETYSRKFPCTFLVTAGATGMYGVTHGKAHFVPTHDVVGLVNTNGAGDAAAGGFLSTHLATHDVNKSLSYALERAEQVLRMPNISLGDK
jgi:sugar/nucleoside kinase (ribokinase family)